MPGIVNQQPQIVLLPETHLVGMCITMSFNQNKTQALWQRFMPIRSTIQAIVKPGLYSVECYPSPDFFNRFDPSRSFKKWAAVAVEEMEVLPPGMESLVLPEGNYAVFHYKGKASEAEASFQYIYASWLPKSPFKLAHRPHFAWMGEHYKGEDPDSEEEFWIPIEP